MSTASRQRRDWVVGLGDTWISGSKSGTIQPLEWYRVKISLRGPRIRVELNDHVLFSCTDDFSQRGDVQLRFHNSDGRFKNIKVSDSNGTVLWEGPPDLP